jgi:hypothetical protein
MTGAHVLKRKFSRSEENTMSTNRLLNLFIAMALVLVAALLVREVNATTASVSSVDSATRSYAAWAKAAESESSVMDSATRSYRAWAASVQGFVVPATGISESTDYYQRHPELGAGFAVTVDTISDRVPLDECFDVSISEVAACREASQ